MKAIHLVAEKKAPFAGALQFIRVYKGHVYATNKLIMIKLPVEEVFGKVGSDLLISSSEELYFDAAAWGSVKMHKAYAIKREGLRFSAIDKKGLEVGSIYASEKIDDRYPDADVVIPDSRKEVQAIDNISFNPQQLFDLTSAFGLTQSFQLSFYGTDKCIMVKASKSEGLGLLMPTIFAKD